MKIEEMVFEMPGPRIGQEDIVKVETAIGAALPNDYKRFLLLYNGGISKLCVSADPFVRIREWMSVCEHEDLPRIVWFFAAGKRLITDIDKFAQDFLAIGELPFGQLLLVTKLIGQDAYRIGIWDLEEPWRKIELPFSSFTDLVNHFTQTDDFI